jgi:uncharacterized OB-fold protein
VSRAEFVPPDPRSPVVRRPDGTALVAGARCTACGYPVPERLERCPVCGGRCEEALFGPGAVVFAATVLRVPVPGRRPPYGLAYVDLDAGPRILAHVDSADVALRPHERVVLIGVTDEGDPLVSLEDAA